jgi:hypothetical protein
VIAQIGI